MHHRASRVQRATRGLVLLALSSACRGDEPRGRAKGDAPPPPTLLINEIQTRDPSSPVDWVEIVNVGAEVESLEGVTVEGQPLSSAELAPGAFAIAEWSVGGLATGETVHLLDALGESVVEVDQVDLSEGVVPEGWTWGRLPDGGPAFYALLLATPGASNGVPPDGCGDGVVVQGEVCEGNDPAICLDLGFEAGVAACAPGCREVSIDYCIAYEEGVVVNELDLNSPDQVELYNGSGALVDVSGWSIVDRQSPAPDRAWVVGAGTVIAAGGYLVLTLDSGFGLDREEWLTMRTADGRVADYVTWEDWGSSVCRIPNGTGPFGPCAPTLGQANVY